MLQVPCPCTVQCRNLVNTHLTLWGVGTNNCLCSQAPGPKPLGRQVEEEEEEEEEEVPPPPTTQEKKVSTPFAHLFIVSPTQYSVELKLHQLHLVRRYPPQYCCFIADRNSNLLRLASGGDEQAGKGGSDRRGGGGAGGG